MDQYYIVKILGRGSEGQVLLAEHKKTHEEFAIKRMEWTSFDDANLHLQEAHRLKQLDHKNILKYHTVFLHKYSADTQFVCICVEYCPGGDLQKTISRAWSTGKHMKEDDIIRYTLEIAEGLSYLHDQNIIHRDLKPQNVLVSKDESLKICDFGISREMGTSLVKTQCGTPNYMSWEMLNKEPYDEMTDLYSLGIILLQFLTGKAVMMSVEMSKNPQMFAELEKELVRRYNYSPDLIHLAQKLVALNPSERPSAQDVIHIAKKIQGKKWRSELMKTNDRLILSSAYRLFNNQLILEIFSYLDIADMYYIALACKSFFNIWETMWWDKFIETKKGSKMIEDLSSESTDSPNSNISRVRRGSTSDSHTSSSQLISLVDTKSHSIHSPSSSMHDHDKKRAKDQIFMYCKISRPQRKRARRNMGKRIVSEIHPSQINDAAEFLAKKFKTSEGKWGEYVFGLTPYEDVMLELHPSKAASTTPSPTTNHLNIDIALDRDSLSDENGSGTTGTSNSNSTMTQTSSTKDIYTPAAAAKQVYTVSDSKFVQMKWFFTCAIRYGIKYGRVWVSTFYYNKLFVREIQGVSIWLHPYNYKNISFWKMLRVGVAYGPQNMGMQSFRRALKIINSSERTHSTVLDQKVKPHWTLFLLAVKPGMTNNGIGSSLLLPVLKSADEQSIPIYTSVYSPSDALLQFYKRHGFDVVEKVEKPQVGPPFHAMIRYGQ